MTPKKITCPSCDSEVFAGRFCLACGAELENENRAAFSEDVIETLADRVAGKVADRLKAAEPKPAETPPATGGNDATKEKDDGKLTDTGTGGRFFKTRK